MNVLGDMRNRYNSAINRRQWMLSAASACATTALAPSVAYSEDIEALLSMAYRPLMKEYDIPGLVVGLFFQGHRYFLELGTTARNGGIPCTRDTLFELGSISKCFTSTLSSLAHIRGAVDLNHPVGEIVHELQRSPISRATLLHLATYTGGGLPLQFPDHITTSRQGLAYLSAFSPSAPPGVIRCYSNPSIGLLGQAIAVAMGGDFSDVTERDLFPALGLENTFIRVPTGHKDRYAWGHDRTNSQVRVNPGVFDAQAYGVKSTARDMLTFLEAHFDPNHLTTTLQRAILETTTPRYQVGPMQQCMGWETYPWPLSVEALHTGNGPRTIFECVAVQPLTEKFEGKQDVTQGRDRAMPTKTTRALPNQATPRLLNKTGSTFGFGAYVALVPHKEAALVMLANRNFQISARVTAAWQVLNRLNALN